jgi:DNA-binding IclR family transcriptional regulator
VPSNDVDKEPQDRAQRAVQSVEVGGRLLLALADQPGAMTLKDLAAKADLPPSRAHPYLVSFGKLGLIEQDPGNGRYALGPAALQLGLACLNQLDPVKVAVPLAQELASRTGHAVALALWGNFGPTVVRLFEARQPLHVAMRAGTVMSLLGTATGQAFAAVLPVQRVQALLAGARREGDVERIGSAPADLVELARVSEDYRQHGLARAVGRPIPGVNAFSAAVMDHEGQPALVITALDHQDHLASAWTCASAEAVRATALDVSRRLGWRAPVGPSGLA